MVLYALRSYSYVHADLLSMIDLSDRSSVASTNMSYSNVLLSSPLKVLKSKRMGDCLYPILFVIHLLDPLSVDSTKSEVGPLPYIFVVVSAKLQLKHVCKLLSHSGNA